MKRWSLAAAVLASGFAPGTAMAASMEYCERYAQETLSVLTAAGMAKESPQLVRDRAYFECLNMDDEPPMPSALTAGLEPDAAAIEQGSAEADEPAIEIAGREPARKRGRSRLEPGTAKWRDWCREHFPNSFDEDTGTIVPSATGRREQC